MGKKTIELGKKYRDTVTGFAGIATCKSEWMNGCVRVMLEPPHKEGAKPEDASTYFDQERLELVKERTPEPVVGRGGGGRKDDPGVRG